MEKMNELPERKFWFAHLVLKSSEQIYKAGTVIYSSRLQSREWELEADGIGKKIANEYVYLCKIPAELIAEKKLDEINKLVNDAKTRKAATIRKREIGLKLFEESLFSSSHAGGELIEEGCS